MNKFRDFYKRNQSGLNALLCGVLYLVWFCALEAHVTNHYHIIHVALDDCIPFCEYFIVPYLMWFAYVGCFWVWCYRHDTGLFRKLSRFLFIGMFTSLLFCTVYPNGTDFRPRVDADRNVFCALVSWLYGTDTPTNVLPSIHAYNSIGIHIAVMQADSLRKKKALRAGSLLLCVLICMATVFLKQHSIVDVVAACLMACAVYPAVYAPAAETESETQRRRKLLLHRSV